mgnify:CR=1 FL=1
MNMKYKKHGRTKVDSSILFQHADRTIQSPIDAIIELVTNSDDYAFDKKSGGKITIEISRKRGLCEQIRVCDNGIGMSKSELERALEEYGKGKSLSKESRRGLFNRGLKEVIAVFRKGKIITCNGESCWSAESYRKENELKHDYTPTSPKGLLSKTGTCVTLIRSRDDKPEKFKVEDYEKLKEKIPNHWALRDIVQRREVNLQVVSLDKRRTSPVTSTKPLSFVRPEGKKVHDKSYPVGRTGDRFQLQIWESSQKLGKGIFDPYSPAGILIRTKGINVDFYDFKLSNYEGFYYFFGILDCDGIYERERKKRLEEGLVDPDRGGLNWRKHPYLKLIENQVRPILTEIIKEKEKQITYLVESSEESEKKNKDIANFLSKLLGSEYQEESSIGKGDLKTLTIWPRYFRVPPTAKRTVTIYSPNLLVEEFGDKVTLKTTNPDIIALPSIVSLHQSTNKESYKGTFKVTGFRRGDYGEILAQLGNHTARAFVEVKEIGKIIRPPEGDGEKRGGIFKNILFENNPHSNQRARRNEEAILLVNLTFPGTNNLLNENGPINEKGVIYLAEVVAEAAFRHTAKYRIQHGLDKTAHIQDLIERFNSEINRLQKNYLYKIHQYISGKYSQKQNYKK